MTLAAGTRLGPYEVTALIGIGGMGEVYSATDTTLKRRVAIKVLPESVSMEAERLGRFQREAEVLATLNHPGIAAIYGVERTAGTTALIMELVDGTTLADRIAVGAIPLDQAVPIAKQIAGALEAAHEHGIVHRDLKPANVKVRGDGTVKVLDFGLAKVQETPAVAAVSESTTIAASVKTEAGVVLGTLDYMSPEQVRGQDVDRRTDVWSFGCVLFEMIAGRPPFTGSTTADTIANLLERDPDWTLLPASTPTTLVRLLNVSALNVIGATWGANDTIVWGEWGEGLFKASANGGTREPFTRLDAARGEIRHGAPHFSTDGKLVFFAIYYRDAATDVGVADAATGVRRVLGPGDGASVLGRQLVFCRGGGLFVAMLDAVRLAS